MPPSATGRSVCMCALCRIRKSVQNNANVVTFPRFSNHTAPSAGSAPLRVTPRAMIRRYHHARRGVVRRSFFGKMVCKPRQTEASARKCCCWARVRLISPTSALCAIGVCVCMYLTGVLFFVFFFISSVVEGQLLQAFVVKCN